MYNLQTSGNQSTNCREMELEFELEVEPTKNWLEESNEEKAIEKTKLLALQLESLINLCVPGRSPIPKISLIFQDQMAQNSPHQSQHNTHYISHITQVHTISYHTLHCLSHHTTSHH